MSPSPPAWRIFSVVLLLFTAGFSAWPLVVSPAAASPASTPADPIDAALEARLRGHAPLDDVRVEALWSGDGGGRMRSVRVYGTGVGILDRKTQFRFSRKQLQELLRRLRDAHVGAMPTWYGAVEGEEEEKERELEVKQPGEKQDMPRLKGRLSVRAGAQSKTVGQLTDGEQSAEFATLVRGVFDLCAEPAHDGVGAASLTEGLRKLAAGELAPETLEITAQRREDSKAGAPQSGWVFHSEGRRVLAETLPPNPHETGRLWRMPEKDFRRLAFALAEGRAGELPINLYARDYTDLRIEVLQWSRVISARRYLEMTPTTRGAAQESFDRIVALLATLNARARQDGQGVAPPKSEGREREKEEKRERD